MSAFAVYISSFDGYSDLWDNFFSIFEQFWADCEYPVYLVNNEKEYCRNGVKVIHTGPEINWFERTKRSLHDVKEEYILFLLEDYYFSKNVNNLDIENILTVMKKDDVYFYRLSPHRLRNQSGDYQKVPVGTQYPITLQPAIWNKEKLIEILQTINGKTPWDFEYYFDHQKNVNKKYYDGVLFDNRDILGYKNGVLRGKWIPGTVNYYKNRGIFLDTSGRNTLEKSIYYKYLLADKVGSLLPYNARQRIKSALNSLHISYK